MILYFLYILLAFGKRSDSVILILCKNDEKEKIKTTLINFEEQFNSNYHYPYVFLNDKDWTEDFKTELRQTLKGSSVKFGKVDPKDWVMPATINREQAIQNWEIMKKHQVPYADKESYHNMCRFYSRAFYNHPLVRNYKYYWRIEPEVTFHCPINYDPFEFMDKNGLMYGFTIVIRDFEKSIETLWDATKEFLQKKNITPHANGLKFIFDRTIPNTNGLDFLLDGVKYNTCHFWSNFEIASFDLYRSKEYMDYMDYLEEKGGFYYERWGDAPIHTLAAALFLDKSKVHYFADIGYTHDVFTNCPANGKGCTCTKAQAFDNTPSSCLSMYLQDMGTKTVE